MNSGALQQEQIMRIRRIADMLCTAHAALRDRYAWRALVLDTLILGLSVWLVALAFVEPQLNIKLTPFSWNSQIWVGVLGSGVFFVTLLQMRTDWKGRADAHRRTLELYAEVKREAGYLIATENLDINAYRRVLSRYDMASAVGLPIPESDFLKQKRRHLIKVALSKRLDARPGGSLLVSQLALWWRDTFQHKRESEK